MELDQAVLYIERMADQNQTDHIDWGFRIACLDGLDYRFMASRGYINDNNLFRDNKFTGFDTPMLYLQVYIPQIAEGMSIILGRIISMPDIEQQLAPNNLMASHSLVYSFDNYTMWGLWTTTKLNANWVLQLSTSRRRRYRALGYRGSRRPADGLGDGSVHRPEWEGLILCRDELVQQRPIRL